MEVKTPDAACFKIDPQFAEMSPGTVFETEAGSTLILVQHSEDEEATCCVLRIENFTNTYSQDWDFAHDPALRVCEAHLVVTGYKS